MRRNDSVSEKKLNDQRLLLEHVLYEMQMYLATWQMMQDGIAVVKKGITTTDGFEVKIDSASFAIVWNTVVESQLIHLRNLIEFFSCNTANKRNKKINDNITCASIIKNVSAEWYLNDSEHAKRMINKAISHLSRSRTEHDCHSDEDAMIHAMITVLSEKIERFLASLQPDLVASDALGIELRDNMIQEQIADIKRWLEIAGHNPKTEGKQEAQRAADIEYASKKE